jgi:hypothetical protein
MEMAETWIRKCGLEQQVYAVWRDWTYNQQPLGKNPGMLRKVRYNSVHCGRDSLKVNEIYEVIRYQVALC